MASANAPPLGGEYNPGRRSSYHSSPLTHSPAARQGTFQDTTPDSKRRSLNVAAEPTLASSPLLRTDEQTPSRSTPTSRLGPSARSSVISNGSLRLSRDLGHDIDWDAVSVKEEDDDHARNRGRHGSESDGEGSQASNGDALTYSALSKRADFILANAKRKLNLLEGNLGRARHSLTLSPTLVTELGRSDSNASAQSAPSPTWSKDSPKDDDRDRIRGPKINFGTPRSTFNRSQNGHSRGYSDSTVPSPQGNTTVGSRSYEYRRTSDWGKRHPLHKSTGDTALDSVPENPGSPTKPHDRGSPSAASFRGMHEGGGQRRVNALVEERLNAQADRIRNRISGIQQRSRDVSERRSSQIVVEDYDSLNEQYAEGHVDELNPQDTAEDESALGVDLPERGDSRLEWRQVLESGKTGPGSAGSYLEGDEELDDEDEDDDDYGEDDENGADDEEFAQADPAVLQAPHEERQDAFDYEHFILHSIMGSHIDINPEDYSSSSEDGTTPTERILDEDVDEAEEANEEAHVPWSKNNGSQSSFHTAHSDEADESGSESEGDRGLSMGNYRDTLKNTAWPVPPSGGNGIKHVRKSSKAAVKKRRPESVIVQQVTAQAERSVDNPEATAQIKDEDNTLFHAVAHSFREVCLRLQTGELGPHDIVDLRQRLEIARRVLDGDL